MDFEKYIEGQFVKCGHNERDKDDEEDDNDEEQEEINVDEEESDSKPEEETHRREIRQKKRQERMEEGSSSSSMTQLMEMIASVQASMNSRLVSIEQKSIFVVSRLTLHRSKRSWRSRHNEEEKIKPLKACVSVRDMLRCFVKLPNFSF
ncbi:hypothetical protein M9H77_21192 [Catharanthus roseus]|uniref:Uncharacterized protein n=1 Tax=Catharanthus roseus TaxID=4058 RepID=A0ACC0AM16_CATRO|nr:hypothetical protein M9H77_21192 [Catharanthus roseus]